MTDGLIVKQPFASNIIMGKKIREYRSRAPPERYRRIPIYLLSDGLVLGTIKITGYKPNFASGCTWYVEVIEEFKLPKLYKHPNGARIWVKNVRILN